LIEPFTDGGSGTAVASARVPTAKEEAYYQFIYWIRLWKRS